MGISGRIADYLVLVAVAIAVAGCGGGGGIGGGGQTGTRQGVDRFWLKGNLHCHSTKSDGDVTPDAVVQWYSTHGYDFLVISDHNTVVDPAPYQAGAGNLILIPGEEVTAAPPPGGYHIGAIGVSKNAPRGSSANPLQNVRTCVDAINSAGGIAMWNHPYHPKFMGNAAAMEGINGLTLVEVYNCATAAQIGPDKTGDSIWDQMLSSGAQIFGTATDDAHHYTIFSSSRLNPGGAWIMVHTPARTAQAILQSVRIGDFYSSTGVELTQIAFDGREIRLSIVTESSVSYSTEFIGQGGVVLSKVEGAFPSYVLTGSPSEAYVRAKVTASDGTRAWTQPVRP